MSKSLEKLRLQDLIAKTAGVNIKQTVRVLLALRAVLKEYCLEDDYIFNAHFSHDKPSLEESRQCDAAYTWLYENEDIQKDLFEIEQYK